MKSWGIRTRIVLLTIVPTLTISILLGIYFISMRISDLNNNLLTRGKTLTTELVASSEYGLIAHNHLLLKKLTDSMMAHTDVEVAAIYDADGHTIGYTGKAPEVNDNFFENLKHIQHPSIMTINKKDSVLFIAPVILRSIVLSDVEKINNVTIDPSIKNGSKSRIGWVAVGLSRTQTTLNEYQAVVATLAISFIGLAISVLFGIRLGRDVSEPLISIISAVSLIRDGKLKTRVKTGASGELQILEDGINKMAQSLESSHDEMQKNIEQATMDLRETLETIEIKNAELDIARKQALEASKVKSTFLANMSHEIRTPMNGVIGFTEFLLKTELSAQQFDYVETIQKSARHLLRIINDILDFSKIESGKLELENSTFNLYESIEDIISLMRPVVMGKELNLIIDIHSDVPEYVMGDNLRFKQILMNLVNNAIKFTEKGNVIITAKYKTEDYANYYLYFEIRDTGVGLSEKQQDRLFRAFTQADSSTSRRYGGTGLGLVICKSLIEKMDGEIGFKSKFGQGSIFWFTIKLKKTSQNFLMIQPRSLSDKNIVIRTDDKLAKAAIKHSLQFWQARAQFVDSDEALIDIVADTDIKVDIILLDYLEPPEAEILKKSLLDDIRNFSNAPIMLLINMEDNQAKAYAEILGIKHVLVKPYKRNQLYNLITGKEISKPKKVSEPKKQATQTLDYSDKKVLAVDDNMINLRLVKILLENLGITVVSASGGRQAIESAKETTFDMILMDIQMPEIDGIEAARQIATIEINKETPIVALTADILGGQRRKLLDKGFVDYQTKPITEQKIKYLLEHWLNVGDSKKLKDKIAFQQKEVITEAINKDKDKEIDTTLEIITEKKYIDLELGKKLAGGSEIVAKEMLDLFLKDLKETKEQIKNAYDQKNYENLMQVAHKLHGGCCYCGVPILKDKVQALEFFLKDNKDYKKMDLEILDTKVSECLDAIDKTIDASNFQ